MISVFFDLRISLLNAHAMRAGSLGVTLVLVIFITACSNTLTGGQLERRAVTQEKGHATMTGFVQMIEAADSIELRVERFGSSDDPAVVLISGAGAPAAFWPDAFCNQIAGQGFQVIRFDHRDTGASTHVEDVYPIATLVADVRAVLDVVNADEIHIVGHSMGGYIVAMIMADSPESRIKSGTAISAGPTSDTTRYDELGMSAVTDETWAALVGNAPSGHLNIDLAGWLSTWRFLNGDRAFDRQLAESYTRSLYTGDPRNAQIAVNHVHAMTTVPSDLPEQLAKIDRPFLVIHGSEDKLVPPDNGRVLSQLTPSAEFYALQGAGHMFFSSDTWDEISTALHALIKR